MVEQMKGDIDEKFSTITSLRSQLQSEKSNNSKELIVLKEQFQKEKDEMQAFYDKKAVENKEHLEKLNEEHENLLQNLSILYIRFFCWVNNKLTSCKFAPKL